MISSNSPCRTRGLIYIWLPLWGRGETSWCYYHSLEKWGRIFCPHRQALSIGATLPQTPSNLGVFHICLLELIRKWDFWASSKKWIRDALLTWYPYLSCHDLDQLIITSITPPLYVIITVHLRFGGQSYNLKYFLPLFSKVHQYWAIITTRTKHISQIRPFTISQTQVFLLVSPILSQEIPSSFFSSLISYASSHLYQNLTTQLRLS